MWNIIYNCVKILVLKSISPLAFIKDDLLFSEQINLRKNPKPNPVYPRGGFTLHVSYMIYKVT